MVPVSSSAQLVLLPWLLGWEQPSDRTTFAAGLHAGSCLGIAWVLRHDLRSLDRRTAALLAGSCVPAAVAGAVAADRVEQQLGRPPQLAVLLAAAGVLLWLADHRADRSAEKHPDHRAEKHPETHVEQHSAKIIRGLPSDTPGGSDGKLRMITAAGVPGAPGVAGVAGVAGVRGVPGVGPRAAALAAFAQVAALAPGVSCSGATLTALRAAGVDRVAAQRFSLLMSLPVTAGAAALTLARSDRATLRALAPSLAVGAVCAALAGVAAARVRQRRPGRTATGPALYRLGLAAAVARRLRTTRKERL